MLTINAEMPIGLLVTEQLDRARIFDRLGIDFYSDGSRSLLEACTEADLDPDRVIAALHEAKSNSETQPAVVTDSISALIRDITDTHHSYLRRVLPRLEELVLKIKRVHGDNHDELCKLADLFQRVRPAMEAHLAKEEEGFFPLCLDLEAGKTTFPADGFAEQIAAHRTEHTEVTDLLDQMRELTEGYSLPEDACNTYQMTFNALAALEADMHVHVFKENHVLLAQLAEMTKTK